LVQLVALVVKVFKDHRVHKDQQEYKGPLDLVLKDHKDHKDRKVI
jgi:hypothetical protein